jgi:hypothetical protein
MRTALAAAAVLVATSALPARALQTDVGASAAQFLQIGAGARALGMGEAYTAVADGPDAAYWNPAGLARMARPEASYARSELPAGIHHDFLAVGAPVELLHGTVAFALTRLTQDSLALVNASNQTQGSFTPHSEVYAFAYGHSFGANDVASTSRDYFREAWNIPRADRPYEDEHEPWTGEIAAGASVKLVNESLGTRSASAYAIDGGGLFRPTDLHELIVAGAIRNIGSKLMFISDREPLPAEIAVSVAYDARTDAWRLLPALEIDAPYAGNIYGKIGLEATREISPGTSGAMRLGYTSVSAADLGILSGVTAGVGLKTGKFTFDLAFQPMGLFGESFRLGVGWKF